MKLRAIFWRKCADSSIKVISTVSSGIGIAFLVWILFEVIQRGASSLSIDFFTQPATPPGIDGGGVGNAMLGTLIITALAALMGVPVGVMSGVYLSEFGRNSLLGKAVRFAMNVIMGVPSIIMGMFVYSFMVVTMGHFSGIAGAVSLSIIMIPVIARTTEDMLRLVPYSLRESALAVGTPYWKLTVSVLFRAAKSGMTTGILLAIARISGETAPLLFTALNSPYWPKSIMEPTANLTTTIFNYAMSPYADWQEMAWGASFVIMTAVLVTTIVARSIAREAQ